MIPGVPTGPGIFYISYATIAIAGITDLRNAETNYPENNRLLILVRELAMMIQTIHKTLFALETADGIVAARLAYQDNDFRMAEIHIENTYTILRGGTGSWITCEGNKTIARIKVEPGAQISIKVECRKKKYLFKKSAGWKLRFSLQNKEGEELLTLLPSVNWVKEAHEYALQLNEEFEEECDSFLILQAVHCANLSMSMMTGGKVPALISI